MKAFLFFLAVCNILCVGCNEQRSQGPNAPLAQTKPESKPEGKPKTEETIKNLLEPETSEELKNALERFDRTKIYPQLILRSRIKELEKQAKQNQYDFNGFEYDNIDSDLAAIYILETRGSSLYFGPDNLKKAGIDRTTLSDIAKENLRHLIPKLKKEKNQDIFELTIAYHPYVAGLILIPEVWKKELYDVKGEIVVAFSSSRTLYVGDSNNPDSIKKLRSQFDYEKEHRGGIQLTTKLYVFRDNRFREFAEEQQTK